MILPMIIAMRKNNASRYLSNRPIGRVISIFCLFVTLRSNRGQLIFMRAALYLNFLTQISYKIICEFNEQCHPTIQASSR